MIDVPSIYEDVLRVQDKLTSCVVNIENNPRMCIAMPEFIAIYKKANKYRRGCRSYAELKRARWFLYGMGKRILHCTGYPSTTVSLNQLNYMKRLAGETT